MKRCYAVVLAWALLSSPAHGDNGPVGLQAELSECAGKKDEKARLSCFDVVSGRYEPGKNERGVKSQAVSKWTISREVSPIDDSQTVTAILDADQPVSSWPGKTTIPSLVFRCKEKKTEAYIVTGSRADVEYGGEGSTVTIRMDKEEAKKQKMAASTDGMALFFGRSTEAINMASKHKTMLFSFTPFSSNPVTTSFNLEGADAVAAEIKRTCGWK